MTTSQAVHSTSRRLEHGATSLFATIANTACSRAFAPRPAPTAANHPPRPRRCHTAHSVAKDWAALAALAPLVEGRPGVGVDFRHDRFNVGREITTRDQLRVIALKYGVDIPEQGAATRPRGAVCVLV